MYMRVHPHEVRLGAWWQAIPAVVSTWKNFTGGDSGGHCWTRYGNRPFAEPCPNTPNYDAVVRAVKRAPEGEIGKLIGYLLGANQGSGPKSRAELSNPECVPFWVKAILGGKGCKASKYPEAPRWFLEFVKSYGAPETPQEELPGSSIPPGATPSPAGVPDWVIPAVAAAGVLFLAPALLKGGRR